MNITEPLNRGLTDALDPAFMPAGGLVKAANARYKIGDQALWQAEGRERVGPGPLDSQPITQGVFMYDAERQPVFFHHRPTSGYSAFALNPAAGGCAVPALGAAGPDAGAEPWELIQRDSETLLATGSILIKPRASLQNSVYSASRLGMPQFPWTSSVVASHVAGAATFTSDPPGSYQYWFTYGAPVSSITSLFTTDEGGTLAPESDTKLQLHGLIVKTPVANTATKITVVLQTKPEWGDPRYLFMYRNKNAMPATTDGAPAYTGGRGTPAFPLGVMVSGAYIGPDIYGVWPTYPLTFIFTDYGNTITATKTEGGVTTSAVLYVGELLGKAYDAVSLQTPLGALSTPRLDPPPSKVSTGDIFQGSLVVNDLDAPGVVKYSYPGLSQAFPSYYKLDMGTAATDHVRKIMTLGNVCGVWLERSVHRLNWLPAASDTEFGQGNIKDLVSPSHGAYHAKGVTSFFHPNQGIVAAWVSSTGVFASDLFNGIQKLTDHVNWTAMGINEKEAWLVNNPKEERLELYNKTQVWYLHYSPSHVVDGVLAITGPISRPGKVVLAAPIQTKDKELYTLTADTKGQLFYEGFGLVDASEPTTTPIFTLETREIYPHGLGNVAQLSNYFVHMKPNPFSQGSYSALAQPGPDLPFKTFTMTQGDRELKVISATSHAEFIKFSFGGTGAAMAINAVGCTMDDKVEETSRR